MCCLCEDLCVGVLNDIMWNCLVMSLCMSGVNGDVCLCYLCRSRVVCGLVF